MSWITLSAPFFFMLSLLLSVESALAFTVTPQVHFDTANQQFYVRLSLRECRYHDIKEGNLTQYVSISGIDRYTAAKPYDYSGVVEIRGSFKASTTYHIKVDGRVCYQSGEEIAQNPV